MFNDPASGHRSKIAEMVIADNSGPYPEHGLAIGAPNRVWQAICAASEKVFWPQRRSPRGDRSDGVTSR